MDLSRRSFLGGVITVVGASIVRSYPTLIPRIYGDGVHDDWEGLTALLNGNPADLSEGFVVVRKEGSVFCEKWRIQSNKVTFTYYPPESYG